METILEDNDQKWASIPLTIPTICKIRKEKLNDALFNCEVYASVKYDGTNIGRDETGLMFGRNKTIKAGTTLYQRAPLKMVE